MRGQRLTRWWGALALLAAIRVAIPLAALVADGSKLPGIPRFTRDTAAGGLTGDATGFYAATREFMAAWGRMPRAVLALDALFALARQESIKLDSINVRRATLEDVFLELTGHALRD